MILDATDSFDVTWQDPGDSEITWIWDETHQPRPLVPLAQDVYRMFAAEVASAQLRIVTVNGYNFVSLQGIELPELPPEEVGRSPLELWESVYEPRTRELIEGLQGQDYAALSTTALADGIEGLILQAGRALNETMPVIFPLTIATSQFMDFCGQELGADGESLGAVMLQATENSSAAAGRELSSLTSLAAESPELADALRAGRYDGLESLPNGQHFVRELERYLDEYGWRAESWYEIDVPTWAEDPSAPLGLISRYLADPDRTPVAAQQRAAKQRAEAIAEAEARITSPKLRARLGELLAGASSYVGVKEGRARWQLMAAGVLRIPIMELGRRFVATGALRDPDDVLYLYCADARALARSEFDAALPLVRERRQAHERWSRLRPPRFIGAPPDDANPPFAALARVSGPVPAPATDARTVTGTGASAGTVRGRARVIASYDEAYRLEPGDVLVCRSTAPPWTPLFAVAGAVVTNTGGILSHAGIVAREYAIPCVVGTGDGTERIPDGARVRVDGEAGVVSVEEA